MHSSAIRFLKSVVSILSAILFSGYSTHKNLSRVKMNRQKNEECMVLGNGPSLKMVLEKYLDEIVGKQIFVVNFFCSTKYFTVIKPSHYVLLDPQIFTDEAPSNIQIKVSKLVDIFNDISWDMILFIPARNIKAPIINGIKNSRIKIVPFNSTPIDGYESLENMFYQCNLGMPFPQTVINATIFIAINLQFTKINLYGVEQSWLKHLSVSEDNVVSVGLPHFYKGSEKTGEDRSLSEFLYSQARAFNSHMRLDKYAKYLGTKIINHTPHSYIDAYERGKDVGKYS